jgi:E3 ubiquitin-protein ligase BRE1
MRLEARIVTVPPLDIVKMEDRKRPSGPDDSAPPAKRQAVTVNGAKSHQDADLPWKDDIEVATHSTQSFLYPIRRERRLIHNELQNYQKDAIMRQMREYKREKTTLEAQLSEMEKRAKFHDDHIRTIDSFFTQVSLFYRYHDAGTDWNNSSSTR